MNTVHDDVLTVLIQVSIMKATSAEHRSTDVVLLVYVALDVATSSQLTVQAVEDALDPSDTVLLVGRADLILAVVRNQVKELRVQVVESLGRTNRRRSKGDERSSGKGVLGGPLVGRGLVIVGDVVEERVRLGTGERGNGSLTDGALADGRDKVLFAGKTGTAHRPDSLGNSKLVQAVEAYRHSQPSKIRRSNRCLLTARKSLWGYLHCKPLEQDC